MLDIVVAKDRLLRPAVADARYHRGVVVGVRDDRAARHRLAERAERRLVRDIAGSEQERRLGPVEVGELLLQQHVVVAGARDVARAARPGAHLVQRLVHRRDDLRVLPHAEIVVAAPDRDVFDPAAGVMGGGRKIAGMAFQIREDAVAAVAAQTREPIRKEPFVIHDPSTWTRLIGKNTTRPFACECVFGTHSWPVCPEDSRQARPCSATQFAVSSSARPNRASISPISASVMIRGGENAARSPSARTIRPCSSARPIR